MKKVIVFLATLFLISGAAALSIQDLLDTQQENGDVAVIQLSGNIVPEASGFSTGITPDRIRNLNRQAENQNVDAVIYEINSGGGAVVASKDLRRNIEAVDVPTVCRFRDTGASGAYLAALGCDEIVADSATITGSIGVTSSYIEFSDLMDEIGVSYVNVTAGENKEVGSPYKEPTEEEKEILAEKSRLIGDEFLGDVVEARNLTEDQREEVSTGEIFLGSEAQDLGLVDSLGGRNQAIQKAENLTDMDLTPVSVSQTQDFNLFSLLFSGGSINSNQGLKAVM
ncbi:MAG: signal peptide peptidase SppA [Candidatus Nanohaloarchaea archaeon]